MQLGPVPVRTAPAPAMSIWQDEDEMDLARIIGAATLLDKMDLGKTLIPTIMQLAARACES